MREVLLALADEPDWSFSFYMSLIYLDVFYGQILQWWSHIFELAHYGQLQLVDATGTLG